MRLLARVSLVLVLILVVVSAYLRLHHSGIGCPDYPICYGMIGEAPTETLSAQSAYERIVAESDAPLSWASPLHRLVASLLGLTTIALMFLSLKHRRYRRLCLALLLLTVFLAMIGLKSGGLHHPAIVMANLSGGFVMLGLLSWLVFSIDGGSAKYTDTHVRKLRPWAKVAIFALCVQILLGGLTSANFAASACSTVPDCGGQWWPDSSLVDALRIDQAHEIDSSGHAIGGEERVSIQLAHRWWAVLTTVFALIAGSVAIFNTLPMRNLGLAVVIIVLAEFCVGIASIMTQIPIALAVAHNWLAALLMMVLVKMLVMSWERTHN